MEASTTPLAVAMERAKAASCWLARLGERDVEADRPGAVGAHPPQQLAVQAARKRPLQAQLLELELDGAVARLPGGLFQRQVAA